MIIFNIFACVKYCAFFEIWKNNKIITLDNCVLYPIRRFNVIFLMGILNFLSLI